MKPINTIIMIIGFMLVFLLNGTASAESYVSTENRFILDGRPFFPIGLYVVECTNGSYVNELDEIADSPFDTLMNYGINQCGTDATEAEIGDYLDELESRYLKLIFSLSEYFDNDSDIDTITNKVNTFKTHPAVISWYLNDERDPAIYMTQLEDRYAAITQADGNHPVWSVHWNPDWLLQEAHTTDIVGTDNYPIAHRPITDVSSSVDGGMQAGKPLWFVPQIFNWQDYPWDFRADTGRAPTREEMRAMSYLATNHGAKGLIYYSYFNIRDDADYPERWDAIKDIAEEIRLFRHVFMSLDQTQADEVSCNNEKIDFKLMRVGETYYLFAVNTTIDSEGQPISASDVSFNINTVGLPNQIYELLKDDASSSLVEVIDGGFNADFGPYEVRIYQWQADSNLAASVSSNNIMDLFVTTIDSETPGYDGGDRPANFLHGLLDMEIEVERAGETAVIEIQLPSPAPSDYSWFKYANDQWIDFSRKEISNGVGDGAEFNAERTKVFLYITDNGDYDDNPSDMIIWDPSGLGTTVSTSSTSPNTSSSTTSSGGGGGGGGGCFIGSMFESHGW
jgi:hypothetical protein